MFLIVTKSGCERCCSLVAKLSELAKLRVVRLGPADGCFVGLGDVVEYLIHMFGLHIVWAWMHGKKATWVCPSCMRRKTWLNKLWYFGDESTKALWLALVNDKDLRHDAQYPFFVSEIDTGVYAFSAIGDIQLAEPDVINTLLEDESYG